MLKYSRGNNVTIIQRSVQGGPLTFEVLDVYVDPGVGQQKPDILRGRWFARRTSQMQNRPPQPIPSVHIEIVGVILRLNRA